MLVMVCSTTVSMNHHLYQHQRGTLINCYAEVTSGNAGAAINLQSGYRTNSVIDVFALIVGVELVIMEYELMVPPIRVVVL